MAEAAAVESPAHIVVKSLREIDSNNTSDLVLSRVDPKGHNTNRFVIDGPQISLSPS
jgi:hypothetical protein